MDTTYQFIFIITKNWYAKESRIDLVVVREREGNGTRKRNDDYLFIDISLYLLLYLREEERDFRFHFFLLSLPPSPQRYYNNVGRYSLDKIMANSCAVFSLLPSSFFFFFCFFFFSSFDRLVFSEWKLSRTTWIFTRTIQAYNPGVRRGPVRVYFPGLSGEELTINTTVGGYKGKLMFRT